ncbi:MAG: hypothetical protein QXU18_00370 [Thermoplasmatales archaeon]
MQNDRLIVPSENGMIRENGADSTARLMTGTFQRAMNNGFSVSGRERKRSQRLPWVQWTPMVLRNRYAVR